MEVTEVLMRIEDLMKERNLSPYQLAKKMNVTPSSIYNMMSRETMPKVETIERICKAIDISVSDFFVFTGASGNVGYMSDDEMELVETYRDMSKNARERVKAYAKATWETEKNCKG